MVSQASTLDEQESRANSCEVAHRPAMTLTVIGCPDEDWRVGELALLAAPESSEPRLLGRGSAQPADPCARLTFARVSGGAIEAALPLGLSRISRVQALVRRCGPHAIEIRNLGRSELLHDGKPVDVARIRPGEAVQFGRQLLLLGVMRTPGLRTLDDEFAAHSFGRADRFGIVGESDAVWALRRRIAFVAARHGHVLIHGASGTGKELVACALHALSDRRARGLVARNAATLPDGIIDAELFGNVRNYPNYGVPERPGLIGQAHGTSLFLDEFAELPPGMQPHLLRVLDGGDYQRLGEATARRSDFRLIAATNRPLETIKEDLRARFAFVLELPDLNDRRDDVPLLAAHLLRQMAERDAQLAQRLFAQGDLQRAPRLSFALLRALVAHSYRSNVRELEAWLWRAIESSRGDELELSGTPEAEACELRALPTRENSAVCASPPSALGSDKIQAVLDEHNGSVEAAWRALGLSNRYTLRRLIAKHGLEIRRKPKSRA
jgi:two-component system nitrogen regulation response regulator GlnG/two-component system response regulator HydG